MCGPVFSYGRFIVRKTASLFSAVFLEISVSFGRKFYLRKEKKTEEASWDERNLVPELKLPNCRQYKKGFYNKKAWAANIIKLLY